MLSHYRQRARTGTAARAGNQQEGIRLVETLGSPDGIDDFIGIFLGYFGAEFVDFTDSMPAGLAPADNNPVLIVAPDTGKPAKVSGIGIYGKTACNDFDTALTLCSFI
jgi:hypothetical protein